MQVDKVEIRVKGRTVKVNSLQVDNRVIVINGKLIKMAKMNDEWNVDVKDPEILIKELKKSKLNADIFTFMQRLPETKPQFNYHMEWDNAAVIPIITFDQWWKNQITRKAKKKGVDVKIVDFDDDFVKGISDIYNETPIRQGKPFWHYGKDFDTLKEIHSTFLDKSDFIVAYYNNEVIGFIKLVYTEKFMRTMHVLSKIEHRNKAPINALIAKAVEICAKRKIPYLVYGQFDYGKKGSKTLSDFKRYNGFEKIDLPRYYIPLTTKGKIILKLKLHHGFVERLPEKLIVRLIDFREKYYTRKYKKIVKQ
jgi:hypothetical protein